ncbi:hypothetical protein WR25_16663 isoform B [Diploscapter pachys]|uniref:CNH domain-containing protein n=1 Tax=Diploscapter pachys TaxID=2018661 RepID=A0A2A2KDP3_9BILA|nr:hypothetical protein WR25_16663 isoform B [Diploscapter pachys]
MLISDSTQSILIGGKTGCLVVYTPSNSNRMSFDFSGFSRGFERKAVTQMGVCEREELLLSLSDGQLSAHFLGEEYPVISVLHKIRSISNFVHWNVKTTGDLYILVNSKKQFHLFKWSKKDFTDVQFITKYVFNENVTNLRYYSGSVYFSTKAECVQMLLISDTSEAEKGVEKWLGDPVPLLASQPTDVQKLVFLAGQKLIGVCVNKTLQFYGLNGKISHDLTPIKFNDVPIDMISDYPYLLTLFPKGRIEIRCVDPPLLVQNITISKAAFIQQGISGSIFAASQMDILLLDSLKNLRKNVSYLLNEKHFDLAIKLAETSNIFTEENKIEMKRQAALNLFNQKKFKESFDLYAEIKSDVIIVLQLFPEFLPEKLQRNTVASDMPANDKKRALLALGDYLVQVRTDYACQLANYMKNKASGSVQLTGEQLSQLHTTLQILDTTLLKCYLKTKPSLIDSLLRLKDNSCYFEDAESILKREGRFQSLYILYESRKKHEMALTLLHEQFLNPSAEPFFKDLDRTVDYLQTLGNTHLELIFKYAKWVLNKDAETGLLIFIDEESELARSLNREAVLEFLRKECVRAVIPYLEHLIYKWEEVRPIFHETLAEFYVTKVKTLYKDYVHAFPDDENITRAGEEDGDLGLYRRSLLKFLHFSLYYSPPTILLQLNSDGFYEERALILGRLKQHEQALTIYTCLLRDIEAAERYCRLYFDREDETNSQVYLTLFRSLVTPSDPMIAGLTDRQLPIPQPDVYSAIQILTRHADRIDTVTALNLIPASTSLRTLSKALTAVLQTKLDQATAYTIRCALSECAFGRYKERLQKAEATKIVVTNSNECTICGKKIGNSAFVRHASDGSLAHLYCHSESQSHEAAKSPVPQL